MMRNWFALLLLLPVTLASCSDGTPQNAVPHFEKKHGIALHYDKLVSLPTDSTAADVDKDGKFDLVYFVQADKETLGSLSNDTREWCLDRLHITYCEGTSLVTYKTNIYSLRSAESANRQTVKVIPEQERVVLIITDEHGVRYYEGNFNRDKPFVPISFEKPYEIDLK